MRFAITIVLAILAVALFVRSYAHGVGDLPVEVGSFSVASGDTLYALPEKIGLDVAAWRWKMYIRFWHPNASLQVGEYDASVESSPLTVRTLLDTVLSRSISSDHSITILP
ncbi:MAG TPA: hypothetical protein PK765_05660 [bacterium]|nr:hypothetical protein [bacterium]